MNRLRSGTLTSAFALCGMTAPVVFAVTVFVTGYLTPGYDPVSQVMSEIGVPGQPYATVMNVLAFGLVGILLTGFSPAVHRAFRPGWPAVFGSALVAGAGLSFLAMAFFHCDQGCTPVTPAGTLHLLLGLIAVIAALLAALTLSYAMHRKKGWGGYWQYSIVTAVLVLAILPVFLSFQDIAGLLQRIMVGLIFVWTEVLAIRIFVSTGNA